MNRDPLGLENALHAGDDAALRSSDRTPRRDRRETLLDAPRRRRRGELFEDRAGPGDVVLIDDQRDSIARRSRRTVDRTPDGHPARPPGGGNPRAADPAPAVYDADQRTFFWEVTLVMDSCSMSLPSSTTVPPPSVERREQMERHAVTARELRGPVVEHLRAAGRRVRASLRSSSAGSGGPSERSSGPP